MNRWARESLEALMKHRNYPFTLAGVLVVAIIAVGIAALTSAHQSSEPLTGNWVVRTPTTNNDGTFRTTYLNLKQEAQKITGTIRVTQFFYKISESTGGPD